MATLSYVTAGEALLQGNTEFMTGSHKLCYLLWRKNETPSLKAIRDLFVTFFCHRRCEAVSLPLRLQSIFLCNQTLSNTGLRSQVMQLKELSIKRLGGISKNVLSKVFKILLRRYFSSIKYYPKWNKDVRLRI